jgi:sigma-B regulation protein RsbU (phosphoserine phosphatase)
MKTLIIDDEAGIRQQLGFVLEDEGYEVWTASTGLEGLKELETRNFDIIITDLMLPDLDGMEIVSRVKQIQPHAIVVMITGHGSIEKAVEAIKAGADDYIPKPLDGNEVVMKLEKASEMKRLRDENLLFQKHLERELETARKIQQSLLPQSPPIVAGLDIGIYNQTATQVGGDFYHLTMLFSGGEMGIAIGDVAGKGMPAALIMANIQASIRMYSESKYSPKEIMRKLNDHLCPICQLIEEHRFVTLFYGVLDTENQCFVYCNAGHNYPLVFKENGTIYELSDNGDIPCGIFENILYEEGNIKLEKNDIMLFYTDGIIEAMNLNNEMFGEDRLRNIVLKNRNLCPDDIISCIYEKMSDFIGDSVQYDDITMMVIKLSKV